MKARTISNKDVIILSIQDEIRRNTNSRYDHRLHAVLLVAQGMSAPEVAKSLGDSPRAVEYWVDRFEKKGLDGLQDGVRTGRPKRLSEKQLQEVNAILRGTPEDVGLHGVIWDGKTLSAFLKKKFGIDLKVRQCQRLFRQLNFRIRKPRPAIAHGDPILQEAFKKKVSKLVNDPKIDLWAIDEVHFQQYGSRCRMWIPPEVKDPLLMHHPGRKSVGYFGAVRIRDGRLLMVKETGMFNAETTWNFLKKLSRASLRSGRKVVVISDNAKYHHALLHKEWRNSMSDRFELLFLPPYSPELNPIERVWKLTRRLGVHNRYFATLSILCHSVEKVFAEWTRANETLQKLCAI